MYKPRITSEEVRELQAYRHSLLQSVHGEITLPYGIRIAPKQEVYLHRGWRHMTPERDQHCVAVVVQETCELLFDLFLDCVRVIIGSDERSLEVFLHSIHITRRQEEARVHQALAMDCSLVESKLLDFESSLVEDGCTAISIIRDRKGKCMRQVRLDFDKRITLYMSSGQSMRPFVQVFTKHDLPYREDLVLVSSFRKVNRPRLDSMNRFDELATQLGAKLAFEPKDDS